jgi:hypothetical protein
MVHTHNPHPFTAWFIEEYGQGEYLYLVQRSKKLVKDNIATLREILEANKKILRSMRK